MIKNKKRVKIDIRQVIYLLNDTKIKNDIEYAIKFLKKELPNINNIRFKIIRNRRTGIKQRNFYGDFYPRNFTIHKCKNYRLFVPKNNKKYDIIETNKNYRKKYEIIFN